MFNDFSSRLSCFLVSSFSSWGEKYGIDKDAKLTSLPEVIWWRSWGEIVSTRGRDSAANPNLVLFNSRLCVGDPAAATEIRAKAVSSVKEDSGFLPVVVEFARVSLPGSSLFLAVDDGFIAVACNEFTRDVRCTTFCCSDCTVEDSFDTRSISTQWSPLLFWYGASRDRLTLESPLMCVEDHGSAHYHSLFYL